MGTEYVRPQLVGMNPYDVLNEAFKEIDQLKAWVECQEKRITWVEQRSHDPLPNIGGSISGIFTTPMGFKYTGNNDNIEIRDMNYSLLLEKQAKLEAENESLKQQNIRMRDVLEFYSQWVEWGERARQTLKELE